ncbi:MAG: sugar kinase [Chloroflexota bacterium]
MLDVVTIGESMVLLVAEQSGPLSEATTFRRHIAGAESNVAIGLARLGHAAGWISRIGDDDFGRAVHLRIRGEGVDTAHVHVDASAPTGVFFRERRDVGPIEVVYYRNGSAASHLSPADLDAGYIARARYLHVTGITPALSESCRQTVFGAAEIARAAGVQVVLDPNYRSKLWSADDARRVLRDFAHHADILLPGIDEADLLTGESDPEQAARALAQLGPRTVIVKVGAAGAVALVDGELLRVPATVLERVIDPIGAGDAFAAGLLAGNLRGFSIGEALGLANRCGALAMSAPGDMEALPRWNEASRPRPTGDVNR